MSERVFLKNGWSRQDDLLAVLRVIYPPTTHSWSVEDVGDGWRVRITRGPADLNSDLNGYIAYPDLSCTRYATLTATRTGNSKQAQVTRGNYAVWCYVSAPMRVLILNGTVKIGDQVAVAFLEGNHDMPCVIG